MNGRIAMRRLAPALVVGAFIMSMPAAASAQLRWGRPSTPRDGACFYRDAGFRGDYFCVGSGDALPNIPRGLNDEISSIRTFGRAVVTVYKDRHFTGRAARFGEDVWNLRNLGWNDRLSSLQVSGWRGGWNDGGYRQSDRGNGYGYGNGNGNGNGNGDGRGYGNGYGYGNSNGNGYGYGSGSGYNTRDVTRAEETVRRAYREVLHREPDAASRSYVERVLSDNWSQNDVERELRRSPEYRNR